MAIQTIQPAGLECLQLENGSRPSCSAELAVVLGYEHSLLRLVQTLLAELGLAAYKQEPEDDTVQTVARLKPSVVIVDVDGDMLHALRCQEGLAVLVDRPLPPSGRHLGRCARAYRRSGDASGASHCVRCSTVAARAAETTAAGQRTPDLD